MKIKIGIIGGKNGTTCYFLHEILAKNEDEMEIECDRKTKDYMTIFTIDLL